jgi:hypothetical protein
MTSRLAIDDVRSMLVGPEALKIDVLRVNRGGCTKRAHRGEPADKCPVNTAGYKQGIYQRVNRTESERTKYWREK